MLTTLPKQSVMFSKRRPVHISKNMYFTFNCCNTEYAVRNIHCAPDLSAWRILLGNFGCHRTSRNSGVADGLWNEIRAVFGKWARTVPGHYFHWVLESWARTCTGAGLSGLLEQQQQGPGAWSEARLNNECHTVLNLHLFKKTPSMSNCASF